MRCDWEECTLSDLGEIVGGSTPSTKKPENYGGNIAWITPKDLSNFSGRFISHGERNITEAGLKSCSARLMPKNTILFSSRAPIGYVAIAANELCTNQGFKSIIPNDDTDFMFLYYLLKYNKNAIELMSNGTTFKEVSGSVMKNITACVPKSKEVQKKISAILSPLDDKIELNRRINDNLEEQARAIFKHWLIDSDYRLGTASEIIEYHDSKRIPISSRERSKLAKIYPYYGAASVMDYVDRYIFDGVYLLLGEDGTVTDSKGFPILQYVDGKFWVNNHAHVITGRNGFSVELLYLLFSMTNVQSVVTGAVQPKISQASLNSVAVVIPPESELQKLDSIIQPLFSMIRNLRKENNTLAKIRDSLIPKLISGEINIM